jgi:hypothetical protein
VDEAARVRADFLTTGRIHLRYAGAVEKLRGYGEELVRLIDWEAILEGTDERFRVDRTRRLFPQYAKQTA